MAADRHKRGDPVYPRVSAPSVVKFLLVPVQKVAGEFDRSHYRRKGIGYLLRVRLLAEIGRRAAEETFLDQEDQT